MRCCPFCNEFFWCALFCFTVLNLIVCVIVKVPKEWKLDPSWEGESKIPQNLSHQRKFPSKWRSVSSQQDPLNTVRIVDHFVIEQTVQPEFEPVNGSVTHWSIRRAFDICIISVACMLFESGKKKKRKEIRQS